MAESNELKRRIFYKLYKRYEVRLDVGADDYIIIPVHPLLLLSRINAMLRFVTRSYMDADLNEEPARTKKIDEKIALNGFEIHLPSRTVFVNGRLIELTTSQFSGRRG